MNLLGEDAESEYVWLACESLNRAPDGVVTSSGSSVPAKITGERIETPGDGSAYVTGVRRLFPGAVADRILNGENLRP